MLEQHKNKLFKIVDGMPEDAHRGLVRITGNEMKELQVSAGDPVLIKGKRTTVARVMPAFSDKCLSGQIQMDGGTRENAHAALGERVSVKATPYEKARKIVLSSVIPGWIPEGDYEIAHLKQKLTGMVVMLEDHISIPLFSGKQETFSVDGVVPQGVVLISKETSVSFKDNEGTGALQERIRYDDVGGLAAEVKRIREIVELPFKYPKMFRTLGIEAPRGVLLYGPPGTGKTLIARAVASETQAHFIHVDGPEIMHKYYGESEARLRQVFQEAKQKAPSIIFLDEIDAIAPPRAEVHGDVEKRVVAQLLALMDGLESRGNVIVLAASNVPEHIDPALRRPGRLDREIAINVPDQQGRLEILTIHTRGMNIAADVSLKQLAGITHGFVGADLSALCREAGMNALNRCLHDSPNGVIDDSYSLTVTMSDFISALADIEPSSTRSFSAEIPSCDWSEIGGIKAIKERLQSLVQWPLLYPDLYAQFGITAPRGILLSGPPGTGKTLAARAVAGASKVNYIPVNSPLLYSRWEGQSEKALHDVFKKAKQTAPCILLFDEIDALAATRRANTDTGASRLLTQLLLEMDAITDLEQIVVLATTNRIDMLDPALLRSGRFDLVLEFSMPDLEDRIEILKVHLRNKPLADDIDLYTLAEKSKGFNGSDIRGLTERAAYFALSEVIAGTMSESYIKQVHIDKALNELLQEKGESPL